ncbi:MAG: DNA-protecting protein DprA [Desulfobulbaceae bacterium]|nr:MAG: DNA-protecting protein DprA [Desulfobulbaceae bacterium]
MTMNDDDKRLLHWLTLAHTPGLGLIGANRLLRAFFNDIEALFAAELANLEVRGLRPEIARALVKRAALPTARQELSKIRASHHHCLTPDHPFYPTLLREISDPPLILYGLGDLTVLQQPMVAVVGARAATSYGRKIAARLASDLAAGGITIISGGACGIDESAHQGALAATGGKTVAVMGCGLDVVYPPQNKKLFAMIATTGMLLSEYSLGTKPEPFRFPARNRIISGIAVGTVVIEAARRSGSLITAKMALEHGREVFAVPGRTDSNKSEGCHRLIQEGAKLVHRAEDVLQELAISPLATLVSPTKTAGVAAFAGNGATGTDLIKGSTGREGQTATINGDQDCPATTSNPEIAAILAVLDHYPKAIEEIIAHSQLPTHQVNAVLLELELLGLVESEPGPKYRRQ